MYYIVEAVMEQIKRKQITDEEIVRQFMNTDTGEIEYSLR